MKKFIALLLALFLLTSISVAAFAADDGSGSLTKEGENPVTDISPGSVPVTGSYQALEAGENFYVNVKWTGMSFTYHPASKGQWNPDTLRYPEDTPAKWTSSDNNKEYGTITVTNVSAPNTGIIRVTFNFVKEFPKDLYMRFSTDPSSLATSRFYDTASFTLKATSSESVAGEEKSIYTAPVIDADIISAADFEDGSTSLGYITVSIAEATFPDPPGPQPGIEAVTPGLAEESAANG